MHQQPLRTDGVHRFALQLHARVGTQQCRRASHLKSVHHRRAVVVRHRVHRAADARCPVAAHARHESAPHVQRHVAARVHLDVPGVQHQPVGGVYPHVPFPVHQHHVAAGIGNRQRPALVVEGDADAAARADALVAVALANANARAGVVQATHDVRSVRVAKSETHQHKVAHLGHKQVPAALRSPFATAAVGRHHPDPVRTHAVGLPVHPHLYAPHPLRVFVAHHHGHLRLGHRMARVFHGKAVRHRRDGLEAPDVGAVLADAVPDLDHEVLAHRGLGQAADALAEGARYLHHAADREPPPPNPALDVMRIGRLGGLFPPHVHLHLLHVVHPRAGVLQRGNFEHAHRCHESAIAREVQSRRPVGRVLDHAQVVRRQIGEHRGGTGQRLHASLEPGHVPIQFQTHRIRTLRLAEHQARTVVIQPLVVVMGKPADKREVRLVVLAYVIQPQPVLGIGHEANPCLGAQLADDLLQGTSQPRAEARSVLQQVRRGMPAHQQRAPVEALLADAHLRDHPEKDRGVIPVGVHQHALAEPFGAVSEPFHVPLAHRVGVKRQLEAVVVAHGLVQVQRPESVQPPVVYAHHDVVPNEACHVSIVFQVSPHAERPVGTCP